MLLSIALAMASLTTSFDVSGVHVILRQNNANNVVAANLYLLGGARQVTDATPGSSRSCSMYPNAVPSTIRRTRCAARCRAWGAKS